MKFCVFGKEVLTIGISKIFSGNVPINPIETASGFVIGQDKSTMNNEKIIGIIDIGSSPDRIAKNNQYQLEQKRFEQEITGKRKLSLS